MYEISAIMLHFDLSQKTEKWYAYYFVFEIGLGQSYEKFKISCEHGLIIWYLRPDYFFFF